MKTMIVTVLGPNKRAAFTGLPIPAVVDDALTSKAYSDEQTHDCALERAAATPHLRLKQSERRENDSKNSCLYYIFPAKLAELQQQRSKRTAASRNRLIIFAITFELLFKGGKQVFVP